MMKKLTALISILALLLALSACSGQAGGTPSGSVPPEPGTASQAVSEAPTQDIPPSGDVRPSDTTVPETPVPTPEPAATPASTPAGDLIAIAMSLIDHPVSELYAAIGQPISSDYAPGCVRPDSEDGELVYDGFIVYTVRTATEEYVYDVLEA